ncbi:class I SAM-dependent methyltransferase [Ferrimonas marina]|uniref:16S rRNA C967 or C1407 C5-methylase, RsmB/RsmF family n=1 Tax=Ferrimonas marina TaxID=299255 RepID=A0A1M5U278_9GAMM|nr:class I SAM-dependent methyltransferase [Ferrimonas marina]SHH56980.1 16S rRNA C967 or C1407 C5-methylase, RsmB/RsmF family [Ferrimonas marina]
MNTATALAVVPECHKLFPKGHFEFEEAPRIDLMLRQYQVHKAKIMAFHDQFEDADFAYSLQMILSGNQNIGITMDPSDMDRAASISALDADYWSKAMNATGLYDFMTAERREKWSNAIYLKECPPFEPEAVITTLKELLLSRGTLFAERVDWVFRKLSGEHKTNLPQGFSKKLIFGTSYDRSGKSDASSVQQNCIQELRYVIATMLGQECGKDLESNQILRDAKANSGKKVEIDGGSLVITMYKKGTMHVEVHPEMAWKLNELLNLKNPEAIPNKIRQPYKNALALRSFKTKTMVKDWLPAAVLSALKEAEWKAEGTELRIGWPHNSDRFVGKWIANILGSLGAELIGPSLYRFEYDARPVIRQVLLQRCVPEQQSYQFYPTGDELGKMAAEWLNAKPGDGCLEPQAGRGDLARFLPDESTTCVELSDLRCTVLKQKGFGQVVCADFLEWGRRTSQRFDKILSNPPFTGGQDRHHTELAVSLLKVGGSMVVILPSSRREKLHFSGCKTRWSEVIKGAFEDTMASVVVAHITREQ